jgi:hypothetical protein
MSDGAVAALVLGGAVVVGGGVYFLWYRPRYSSPTALAKKAAMAKKATPQVVTQGPAFEAKSGIGHFNGGAGNRVAGAVNAAVGPKQAGSSTMDNINTTAAIAAGVVANSYVPGSGLIVAPVTKKLLPGAEKVGVTVGKGAYNVTKSVVSHLNPFSW